MCEKLLRFRRVIGAAVVCVAFVSNASADFAYVDFMGIQFAPVGNINNAGISRPDIETTVGFGAVGYEYLIGKYPVTAGQYTEFLNAVGKSDPDSLLWTTDMVGFLGCNIQRSGSNGDYIYTVAPDWANRPVNHVSFWSAARFVNWIQNGRPTGPMGPGTTEDGAYINIGNHDTFARTDDAVVWLPTHHEWYKAAYHNNIGLTAEDYYYYPMRSDSIRSNELMDPDPGNSACFLTTQFTIGDPYYRTEVGDFKRSWSPYGTFDQGGNVYEWSESASAESRRQLGGSFMMSHGFMHAREARSSPPETRGYEDGFRIAADYWYVIPEPGSATLLLFAAIAGLLWRRR